jgi:hypothetical protein
MGLFRESEARSSRARGATGGRRPGVRHVAPERQGPSAGPSGKGCFAHSMTSAGSARARRGAGVGGRIAEPAARDAGVAELFVFEPIAHPRFAWLRST